MKITFPALGLKFEADVEFYPGEREHVSGPPDSWEPGTPDEVDFETLSCDGNDALFLLDSKVAEQLIEAAIDAVHRWLRQSRVTAEDFNDC